MIGLVSALFCFCWFPIHLIHFSLKFLKEFPVCSKLMYTIKALSHTFIYLNSMLNPFFYTIMGNSFQKKIIEQKVRLQSLYSRGSMDTSLRRRKSEFQQFQMINSNRKSIDIMRRLSVNHNSMYSVGERKLSQAHQMISFDSPNQVSFFKNSQKFGTDV